MEWREDWIYLLDHTIDFGVKKCLVVLGVTLEKFRQNKCKLCHQDMEILAIAIHESATAVSVQETLETVSATTGVPAQIVSDNGSNIKRGVEDFLQEKAGTKYTYDITHKAGAFLKHHLEDDANWKLLVNKTCETKRGLPARMNPFGRVAYGTWFPCPTKAKGQIEMAELGHLS